MFLPPKNKVWGKVIFLHPFVILFTGGVPGLGGCLVPGGCLIPGEGLVQGGSGPGGVPSDPPRTATDAGGTHPTGMHSCLFWSLHYLVWIAKRFYKFKTKNAIHIRAFAFAFDFDQCKQTLSIAKGWVLSASTIKIDRFDIDIRFHSV